MSGPLRSGWASLVRYDILLGLFYRRNRYNNPEQGRFTQEDPIGLAGGMNLYGYAEGDPVNFSDPFGLCPWCIAIPIVLGGGEISAGTAALLAAGAVGTGVAVANYQEIAGAVGRETDAVGWQLGALAKKGAALFAWQAQNDEGMFKMPGTHSGDFTKLRGDQGWRDPNGLTWKKDKLHRDHWDVSDKKGNKLREVDFGGREIWPEGPKNRKK